MRGTSAAWEAPCVRAPRALTLTERAAYGRRMVHWLDDAMPLQSAGEACAVVMRANDAGEEGVRVLRWCADHADVLMRQERCLQVRRRELAGRRYNPDVEHRAT